MSESSFRALICSETARRMAEVDSFCSSGISDDALLELGAGEVELALDRARRAPHLLGRVRRSWLRIDDVVMALRILSADSIVLPSAFWQRLATRFSNERMTLSRSSDS